MLITIVGLLAAALTSLSYIPQVKKALPPGSTEDLSSKNACSIGGRTCLVDRIWRSQRRLCDHLGKCRRPCLGRHADRVQDPGCALKLFVAWQSRRELRPSFIHGCDTIRPSYSTLG